MKFFNKHLFLLLAIVFLGYFLRHDNYLTWPRHGATFDEYAWTWVGINLIKNQVPMSWSPHEHYKNYKHVTYEKAHFRVVTPWLEHPPLFGLAAGSFAMLRGADDMYQVTLHKIRPLALLLGTASIVLLYLLVSYLYGRSMGLLAAGLYATIPTIVVGSRIVQNENFFIPMWLLALYLIARFIKEKKARYRNLAAVICGLLILAKIPWIAATGSLVFILLFHKKYKDSLKVLAIVLPFFFMYLAYGFYYDGQLFMDLWRLQANRYDITFTSIYSLFQKPFLIDRYLTDGWIYFGWFAFIFLLLKDIKKHYIIVFGLLAYFGVFLAGIPDEPGHGWYRYPFYPFLAVSIAFFIKDYFAKNWLLTFMFLVFVGTALLGLTWEKTFGFSYIIFRLAIIGWGLTLLPLFFQFKKITKFATVASYCWLAAFAFMNIWAVLLYNEQ